MAVVINTNVDSLKIQNILNSATTKMSSTMQKMSSGLKIISAADDPAGNVISARMDVQLDGNKIGQNNIQNANALLSTAEGNVDVILDNMTRIRDLTLQAKNGTYSKEEIQAMEDEVLQRIAEIDRVASSSMYSSLKLFGETKLNATGDGYVDGGLAESGATFQVGANPTDDNTILADKALFADISFGKTADRQFVLDDYKSANSAALTNDVLTTKGGTADDAVEYNSTSMDFAVKTKLVDEYADDAATAPEEFQVEVVTDILCYNNTTGEKEWVSVADYNTDIGGAKNYTALKKETLTETDLYLTALTKDEIGQAVVDLDNAIDNLTHRKSIIGSAQNRLDSALDTLTTQYENLSSAKSIITDADIASEASAYTQQSILQQVSTSLLAQANQAPSVALSLV